MAIGQTGESPKKKAGAAGSASERKEAQAKSREAQFDAAVEAALLDPEQLISVPEDLQQAMREEGLDPVIATIRFLKLTPRRQGNITDTVMRKFHQDLRDPDLLSDDQIMELAVAKGAWGPEQDQRLAALQEQTTGQMATLYQDGVSRSAEWTQDVQEKADRFTAVLHEDAEKSEEARHTLAGRFQRWLMYTPGKRDAYSATYAEEFPKGYNPDRDLSVLLDEAPTLEAVSLLEEIEELREKIEQYLTLRAERLELDLLVRKRTEIFSNSVESRQRNAGQLARLYYTSERVVDGRPSGPLMPTFDALYDLPPDLIRWLVEEQFFFHNNIPRAAREYLDEFGFQVAERTTEETASEEPAATATSDGSTEPSDASLAPLASSNDSPLPVPDASSSASPVATT